MLNLLDRFAMLVLFAFALLLPARSTATIVGDVVDGCFSATPCTAGTPGFFLSGTATVSESTVEFSGAVPAPYSATLTADFLTFNGADTIRITLTEPSSPLPSGYSIGFFDLDWLSPTEVITGAAAATSFLFSQIDQFYNVADCEGDNECIAFVSANNAAAKANSVLPVMSLVTTADSVLITLGTVTPPSTFGSSFSIDVVLATQVVPEPSTALLLAAGCAALSLRRSRCRALP